MDRFLCEFRAAGQDAGRISGHAHVFGRVASIRGGLERVSPVAFNRALAERQDVVLVVNHEGLPLGRTASGTLRLGVDERGLTIDNDLPDTTLARDVRELMARGDLRSMSFGFIPRDGVLEEVEGRQVRTITDLDLFDVSIVTHPAYAGTEVALRAIEHFPIAPAADPEPEPAATQFPVRLFRALARIQNGNQA